MPLTLYPPRYATSVAGARNTHRRRSHIGLSIPQLMPCIKHIDDLPGGQEMEMECTQTSHNDHLDIMGENAFLPYLHKSIDLLV